MEDKILYDPLVTVDEIRSDEQPGVSVDICDENTWIGRFRWEPSILDASEHCLTGDLVPHRVLSPGIPWNVARWHACKLCSRTGRATTGGFNRGGGIKNLALTKRHRMHLRISSSPGSSLPTRGRTVTVKRLRVCRSLLPMSDWAL